MTTIEHIQSFYKQYLSGTISEENMQKLMLFFDRCTDVELQEVVGALEYDEYSRSADLSYLDLRVQLIYEQINAHNQPVLKRNAVRKLYLRRWISAVAAVLVIALVGHQAYRLHTTGETQKLRSIYGDDVAPGGNRATLTLSDGTTMALSESKDGIVVNGTDLHYSDGEELVPTSNAVSEATVRTPRGGQYKVTLSDGTVVTLNAKSSLTYPNRFDDDARVVKLTGEGYFDVVQNTGQPFIVETNKQQITVTGTTFNVNTYDEEAITTTLITGSVNIKSKEGTATTKLKAGQEAFLRNGAFDTRTVDVDAATGWVRGVFVFQNTTLAEILPQLERWYDIEVDINPIPHEEFYAEINRNMSLSTVLKAIEKTSNVHFEIKGRRLTLKNK